MNESQQLLKEELKELSGECFSQEAITVDRLDCRVPAYGAFDLADGSFTRNRLPAPSALCTSIVPWCAAASHKAIDSPNPAPGTLQDRDAVARKKRSKIRD